MTRSEKRAIRNILEAQFLSVNSYRPSFRRPRSFNEKIQWLKLNYQDPLMTRCADKYDVRDYVSDTVGDAYLIPLLGVWDDPADIQFEDLPDQFALKVTNGSGANIICKDKGKLDVLQARTQLASWMRPEASHYHYSFEWAYKNIDPRVIAEQFLPEADDLVDFKVWCFQGSPKFVMVCTERSTGLKVDFFTTEWEHLPFARYYPNSERHIPRPKNLEEMLRVAQQLAEPFPFVRVDLYESSGAVAFGELTFYPGNGMEPFEPVAWDFRVGSMLRLPSRRSSIHVK